MFANRTTSAPQTPTPRSVSAQRAAALRSRTTNDPSSRFDLNSAEGRRARDLYEGYVALMGNPSDTIALSNALAAAELKARAELSRKSPDVDPDVLVRLENLAHRAERKLGIKPAAATPAPSLRAYVAARASSEARDASEDDEAHPQGPQDCNELSDREGLG
jgi:hypothetical protein